MAEHYCPDCRSVLNPGAMSCPCGWRQTEGGAYPTLNGLTEELDTLMRSLPTVKRLSFIDPHEPGRWWVWFMGKPTQGPQQVNTRDGVEWRWAYADEVKRLLHVFLRLPHEFQTELVRAREDGIHWRGEWQDDFRRVMTEYLEMQRVGPAEYRQQALKKLKHLKIGG